MCLDILDQHDKWVIYDSSAFWFIGLRNQFSFYRPRERGVCLCVCLSLFLDNNFWTDWPIDLIFGMLAGHYHI